MNVTSHPCSRCETLPGHLSSHGNLYLWPPLGHSMAKVTGFLTRAGYRFEQVVAQGYLAIEIPEQGFDGCCTGIHEAIGSKEGQDTLALYLDGNRVPDLNDIRKVISLDVLIARQKEEWLIDVLREKRLTNHFQPIFHANDTREPFAHECLLRGLTQEGEIIPPGKLFHAATTTDLLFQLDRAARAMAVKNAASCGIDSKIFINFTPTSIYDPQYCLQSTVKIIKESGLMRDRIVFEVIETEKLDDPAHLATILKFYRHAGFQVALDDLGSGYSSLNLLPVLKPDYIKIDRELISGIHKDRFKIVIVEKLVDICKDLGILVVAEGIEIQEELTVLQQLGVDFVQGFLLARPSAKGWIS
ncbi:MAG: EAL domain-containing protein [Magnetococcales bacterium]|nr:EAL domain-containing protein [Magnetococcales bacterium]